MGMDKSKRIRKIVKNYYEKPNTKIDWNKWVFKGHNEVVVDWIKKIAKRHEFDEESVITAAYLHDIAYSWTDKNDPTYEKQSLVKAREILEEEGFSPGEITFIVDDILSGHGTHKGRRFSLIEARVLTTADALAHLTTDFFLVMGWHHYLFEGNSLNEYKAWVLKKIERDFSKKIAFKEFKRIARPYYEALKKVFSGEATL